MTTCKHKHKHQYKHQYKHSGSSGVSGVQWCPVVSSGVQCMCLWCANTDTNADANTSRDAITKPYKKTKTDKDTDVNTDTNAKNKTNAYTNMNTLTILIQMHTPMRVRKIIHASNGIFICVCLSICT